MSNLFHFCGFDIPVDLIQKTGAGPETFEQIADNHITLLQQYIGVKDADHVMEIGCGIGRDAIPLTKLLDHGHYIGTDTIAASIRWCTQNISVRFPNFVFVHHDIQDTLHNPMGTLQARDVRLPAGDNSIDLIILQSVFTHMFPDEILHYMKEFRRILKPTGRVWATFFIVHQGILDAIRDEAKTQYALSFQHLYRRGCYVNSVDEPRGAVAFEEDALKQVIERAGLILAQPILWGTWSGQRPDAKCGQDSLILMKANSATWPILLTQPNRNCIPTRMEAIKMINVILVLGMHRSGTSAAAGFLVKLGGAQPKTLMPAEGGNERGYFESQALMTFHDELLASAGSSWADWRQFNPAWYQSPAAPAFQERAKQLFHEEFDGEPLVVLKDPRVCRFAPFWLEVLAGMKARARVVIPVRAPLEVAFSMQKRFGFSLATGALLWLRHIIDAEIASRALRRSIFTWDQLLRDWRSVAEKASTDLGLRWPRLSDATAHEIENFIGYDLVHHRVSAPELAAHPDIHEWTMAAYRAMRKLARAPRSSSALKKLDKIRDAFNRASRMFGRTVFEEEIRSQDLLRKTAKLAEERDHWLRQHDAARAELAGALQAKEQISVELNARAREASDLAQALDGRAKLRRSSQTVTRSREFSEDASPMDAQSYFSTKLIDMGELDSRLAGIWTPESQCHAVPVGLTEQFTGQAGDYAAKYANTDYFRSLIVRGLALSGARLGRAPRILDIGTGAGDNSVFPCLDLFENAEIIATDLSPDLLVLLRREVDRRRVADSVTIACADAMLDVFVPDKFDLVTGMAILHHLIDPSHALVAACRALKPGGFAMFFEPFEFGHSILTLIFERIMSEASLRADGLDPTVLHFMHLFTEDARRRLGRDKSSAIFREVDDKWLFSKSYLREVGKAAGFEKVRVESIHNPKNQITDRAAALLSLGANAQLSSLPAWAQTIVAQAQSAFSETRNDMIFEGIVTMRKPGA